MSPASLQPMQLADQPTPTVASALPSRAAIFSWAAELYSRHVDNKDAARFANAFTPDGWVQFGNGPQIRGRPAIEAAIAQFFSAFVDLRHESIGSYIADDTLILEARVTYTRFDRQRVTVPAVTIFRIAGISDDGTGSPVADQCRIYVDLAPLFAPSATQP